LVWPHFLPVSLNHRARGLFALCGPARPKWPRAVRHAGRSGISQSDRPFPPGGRVPRTAGGASVDLRLGGGRAGGAQPVQADFDVKISQRSCAEIYRSTAPGLGVASTRPSRLNSRKASRTGVRDVPSSAAIVSLTRIWPGRYRWLRMPCLMKLYAIVQSIPDVDKSINSTERKGLSER